MRKYKSDEWLRDQLELGRSVESMAKECGVTAGTIDDALRRNGLNAHGTIPDDIQEHEILRWCGAYRRMIPSDVTNGTAPQPWSTVLIIGAGGFVGTNLISYLAHNTKYRVIPATRRQCDAMNRQSIDTLLCDAKPSVVVNLAAFVGGIGLNLDNPADMIYRNLIMSANITDACFTAGVRKLINIGTVCAYPHTPPHIPFLEDDIWEGRPEPTNEPYGVAKKTIGLMLAAYKRQFNFSSAYLIPTNMYGPHDDFSLGGSHVIPAMVRKFVQAKAAGTNVTHWGDGSATRDFLYVDDFCEAVASAITSVDRPIPINIGSGCETSMRQLSEMITDIVGYTGTVLWDVTKPNGQPRRCLDTSRANSILGYNARTDIRVGLESTIKWYIENVGNPEVCPQ